MKKRIVAIPVCILLLISSLVIVSPVEASKLSGNTLFVGGSGPGNYTSIQDAVDDANTGDTVFVYNGTYYENIVLDKTVDLIGEDKNITVIDGKHSGGDVIYVSADMVNISGFMIINSEGLESGIEIRADGNIITDNILYNNFGGIGLFYSSYNSINSNTFISSGAGILLAYSNSNNVMDNNFSNSGLWIHYSYYNNIFNNTVNGKPLVYLENESDTVIDVDAGQVILVSCDNITIQNQELSNTSGSIILRDTNNCLISSNNIISSIDYGMHFIGCSGNTISNNNISFTAGYAMELRSSNNNYILSNNISNNGGGIDFSYSSNNYILSNTIFNCDIMLGASSSNNKFYHNNFIQFYQLYSHHHNIWDNGYPSGGNYWDVYTGVDNYHGPNQDIPGSDGIGDTPFSHIYGSGSNRDNYPLMNPITSPPIFVWVDDDFDSSTPGWQIDHFDSIQDGIDAVAESGTVYVFSGTYYENVVIDKTISLIGEDKNTTIVDGSGIGHVIYVNENYINISGFKIQNSGTGETDIFNSGINISSDYNHIFNNIISNNHNGIKIRLFHYNKIENNILINNNYWGIHLKYDSDFNDIINNTFISNGGGIGLDGASNNVVTDNYISDSLIDISLHLNCNNNIFSNNILNNSLIGIEVFGSDYNDFIGNTISNSVFAMSIELGCFYNTVSGNTIVNATEIGIGVYNCQNNTIYHNNFLENSISAEDSYILNDWDNGYPSGGNYWDDYNGSDNYYGINQNLPGPDGIGDTPYNIPDAGNKDFYPLMTPYGPPCAIITFTTSQSTVYFNSTYSYDYDGNIVSYYWEFGDGNTSTEQNPTHEYSNPGNYTVCLNVTDNDGLFNVTFKLITIIPKNQKPEFGTPLPHDGATNQPIELLTWSIPISDPEGDLFNWSIECSNGQTKSESLDTNGTKQILLSGLEYYTQYTVWVNATDPYGSEETNSSSYTFITAYGPPCDVYVDDDYTTSTTGFCIDHFPLLQMALDHVCIGGTVHVYPGNYGEGIDHYNVWVNGITIIGEHIPLTFNILPSNSAIITLPLHVTGDVITVNYLVFNPSTTGAVIVSGEYAVVQYNKFLRGCISNPIGIENLGQTIVDARFNWWGRPDGPSGYTPDAITGRIADGLGVEIVDNGPIIFDPWAGIDAVATASETVVETGEIIIFDSADSFAVHFDGTGNDFDVLWDFDDGAYSMEKQISHVFTAPGTYEVSLRIQSQDPELWGEFMYDWDYITITVTTPGAPLSANADGNDLGGYETTVDESVQLYGLAVGGTPPYTYSWEFGDGKTSTDQNPTHIYETAGTYTATLTVIDSTYEVDSDDTVVIVHEISELVVNIIVDKNTITNLETLFTAMVIGGVEPYTYNWDFGDGTISTDENPTHEYENIGTYTITLTVTDNDNNKATDTTTITVEEGESDITPAEIKQVNGGFSIKAIIAAGNIGCGWSISVQGNFILFGGETSGTIEANTVETVKLPLTLSFGKTDITVTANDIQKEYTAFALGPLFFNLKEA